MAVVLVVLPGLIERPSTGRVAERALLTGSPRVIRPGRGRTRTEQGDECDHHHDKARGKALAHAAMIAVAHASTRADTGRERDALRQPRVGSSDEQESASRKVRLP